MESGSNRLSGFPVAPRPWIGRIGSEFRGSTIPFVRCLFGNLTNRVAWVQIYSLPNGAWRCFWELKGNAADADRRERSCSGEVVQLGSAEGLEKRWPETDEAESP